jgi:hypothetical protein
LQVARAKQDGRWDAAYDSPANAEVPADLAAALDPTRRAQAFFRTLDRANRYAILWRIQTVKKAETRARRIRQFVEMLERHEKVHPDDGSPHQQQPHASPRYISQRNRFRPPHLPGVKAKANGRPASHARRHPVRIQTAAEKPIV